MLKDRRYRHILLLAAGLAAGTATVALLSQTPVHAVATDRQENFAICTGPVDADIEAVYFLDMLTGDLKAAILSTVTGKFTATYEINVLQPLGIEPGKNPRYLMVTGIAELRRGGGQIKPAAAVVYVAEITSGKIGAFAIPWNRAHANSPQPYRGALFPLDVMQFRTAAVR